MFSLKDYVWDYEHISAEEQPVLEHAEQNLFTAVQCMVRKISGMKIGAMSKVTNTVNSDVLFTYTFCSVFGDVCYKLNHNAHGDGLNTYSVINRLDKRIISTGSYTYFCRNIIREWKNDNYHVLPNEPSMANSLYSMLVSRIKAIRGYVKDATGNTVNDLQERVKGNVHAFKTDDIYTLFGAALGETPLISRHQNSLIATTFDQAKSYVQLVSEFNNNFRHGTRLVLFVVRNSPISKHYVVPTSKHYVVTKFADLVSDAMNYRKETLLSAKYLRSIQAIKEEPELMARIVMLNAHSGENLFDKFLAETPSFDDKPYAPIRTLLLSFPEAIIFPGD